MTEVVVQGRNKKGKAAVGLPEKYFLGEKQERMESYDGN